MFPASSGSENGSGFLSQCLVESDRRHEKRDRRNKQRALIISIVVQILIVTALILFPLFSKGENIAGRVVLSPAVPYARGSSHPHQKPLPQNPRHRPHVIPGFWQPKAIPIGIVTKDPTPSQQTTDNNGGESDLSHVRPGGSERGIPFADSSRVPVKPDDDGSKKERITTIRRQISEPVQQAMLIHRVEPVYPILALQTRREGRVLLHAIISVEGRIESLQVVSGDPIFIRSALDAVREWHYRATVLDGKQVEVETYITVIYTLSH
jgi:TonB family protein